MLSCKSTCRSNLSWVAQRMFADIFAVLLFFGAAHARRVVAAEMFLVMTADGR
jgi:hypothetical protein